MNDIEAKSRVQIILENIRNYFQTMKNKCSSLSFIFIYALILCNTIIFSVIVVEENDVFSTGAVDTNRYVKD